MRNTRITPGSWGLPHLLSLLFVVMACGADHEGLGRAVQATEDTEAPTWPSGAALSVTLITPTRVGLSWPEATDNVAVAGYRIYRNYVLVATVEGGGTSWTATSLTPSTTYEYAVAAFDAVGNEMTSGASLTASPTTAAPSAAPAWSAGAALTVTRIGKRRVHLSWDAASDDHGELRFEVSAVTGSASFPIGTIEWFNDVPVSWVSPAELSPSTAYTFEVRAVDYEGNTASPVLSATGTTRGYAELPVWEPGAAMEAVRKSWDEIAGQASGVGLDVDTFRWERRHGMGAWEVYGNTSVQYLQAGGFTPGHTWDLRVSMVDVDGLVSAPLTASREMPLPEVESPPELERSQATDLMTATSFLFTGTEAVQQGLQQGQLVRERVAVLRGRAIERDATTVTPVPGARVTVVGHTEFGHTFTREDGYFDLVVNGGDTLVLDLQRPGYVSLQRAVESRWQEHTDLGELAMTSQSATSSPVTMGASAWQLATSAVATDESGPRAATVAFAPNTTATMVLPDGSSAPLPTSATLRVTELTVGARGRAAMPGTLPSNIAYTWAADFAFDEAAASHATRVTFNQPVAVYIDNFLGFGSGEAVPIGHYDEQQARWIANEEGNGIVVQVLASNDSEGNAEISLDGDNDWDASDQSIAAQHGITAAERGQLRVRAGAGNTTSLWRVRVTHFSKWDANWGVWPPDDAKRPYLTGADVQRTSENLVCRPGSIIGCQNRSLGETIPLRGTPFSLHYWSDRARGRIFTLQIPVGTPEPPETTLPASLRAIVVEVHTPGRVLTTRYDTNLLNRVHTVTWDDLDGFGRNLQGAQPVEVRVGYVYPQRFARVERFGYNGNGTEITGDRARGELTLWSTWRGGVGGWDAQALGLGGWTLDAHHVYDPIARTVHFGSGGELNGPTAIGPTATKVIGGGAQTANDIAVEVAAAHPTAVTVGPDGSVWFAGRGRIQRISPAGRVYHVAGTGVEEAGEAACGPDGPNPLASAIPPVYAMELRGSQLIVSEDGACDRIRVIDATGIHTIVGATYTGSGPDGPGTSCALNGPRGLKVSPDGGYLLLADSNNGRVRRYDFSSGLVRTVAGGGSSYTEAALATSVSFDYPHGVDLAADGAMLFTDVGRAKVYRVGTDGRVRTFAGTGTSGFQGDGGPAVEARLWYPLDVRALPEGAVLILDSGNRRIRQVRTDGLIQTLVGDGVESPFTGYGRTGPETRISGQAYSFDLAPDGTLYLPDEQHAHILRYAVALPGFRVGDILVPSPDGSELYTFDGLTGCHRYTDDAVTGRRRYAFVHQVATCRLTQVQIGPASEGNVVEVHHASASDIRVRSPFYAASSEEVQLTLDGSGYLQTVTHAGASWSMQYSTGGLLTRFEDPLARVHTFAYTATGLLSTDTGPTGTVTTLTTSNTSTGQNFLVTAKTGTTAFPGASATHQIERNLGGSTVFTNTSPGGVAGSSIESRTTVHRGGFEESTVSQGTTTIASGQSWRANDNRLGAGATYLRREERVVAGRTIDIQYDRTTTEGPGTPRVLLTRADAVRVNGEPTPRVTTTFTRTDGNCGNNASVVRTTRGTRSVRTCLDADGRISTVQVLGASPALEAVQYHYDSRGRVFRVTQGARGVQTTFRTDGRVESVAAGTWASGTFTPLLSTTTTWSSTTRRPTGQTLPGNRTVGLELDAMGQLRGLTPPGRTEHTMAFDGVGRMTSFTSPAPEMGAGALTLGWAYNGRGQLSSHTRADASSVTFAYDEPTSSYAGTTHLDSVTWPAPVGAVTYGYRATTGEVERVEDAAGCRLRAIYEDRTPAPNVPMAIGDDLGDVSATATCPVRGLVYAQVNDLFEPTSFRVGTSPNGTSVNLTWDADSDRLLTAAGGMTLGRDTGTGRLTGTTLGSVSTSLTYTGYGEIDTAVATVSGATELGFDYGYDALGRIESVVETGNIARTRSYVYDTAGRLWKVQEPLPDGGVSTLEQYDYDTTDGPNGNRTSWTVGGVTTTATYDAQDRLRTTVTGGVTTTYGYDSHGNITSRADGTTTVGYTWDPRGPLAQVTRTGASTIDYVLDPLGRRIGRKVAGTLERAWLYEGIHPVAELDGDGTTVRRVFVYATRGHSLDLVLHKNTGGTWDTYRVLSDHLGSVRAVVKSDGTVVQRMDYDAFGRVVNDWNASGWTPVPFGYAGGIYDRDTGLVRFGAREYDARVGRWISRDPILFGGGDGNLYGYCTSDPVNFVDDNGATPIHIGRALLGAVVGGGAAYAAGRSNGASGGWLAAATIVGVVAGAATGTLATPAMARNVAIVSSAGLLAVAGFGVATVGVARVLQASDNRRFSPNTQGETSSQMSGGLNNRTALVCRGPMNALPRQLGHQHYWVVTSSSSIGAGSYEVDNERNRIPSGCTPYSVSSGQCVTNQMNSGSHWWLPGIHDCRTMAISAVEACGGR